VIDSVVGLLIASFGLFVVLRRSALTNLAVDWNRWLWRIRFARRPYEIGFLVAGTLFVVLGFLASIRVIEFR